MGMYQVFHGLIDRVLRVPDWLNLKIMSCMKADHSHPPHCSSFIRTRKGTRQCVPCRIKVLRSNHHQLNNSISATSTVEEAFFVGPDATCSPKEGMLSSLAIIPSSSSSLLSSSPLTPYSASSSSPWITIYDHSYNADDEEGSSHYRYHSGDMIVSSKRPESTMVGMMEAHHRPSLPDQSHGDIDKKRLIASCRDRDGDERDEAIVAVGVKRRRINLEHVVNSTSDADDSRAYKRKRSLLSEVLLPPCISKVLGINYGHVSLRYVAVETSHEDHHHHHCRFRCPHEDLRVNGWVIRAFQESMAEYMFTLGQPIASSVGQLHFLLFCYLSLNDPSLHSAIRLAFVLALQDLAEHTR